MNFNIRQHLRASLLATSAALLFASSPCASAQAVFGQILGTVTDSTGAAIPNATITVTDVAKGTSVTLTSNGAGEFTADHLIPDTYTVKVTAPGFKVFQQTQLNVIAGVRRVERVSRTTFRERGGRGRSFVGTGQVVDHLLTNTCQFITGCQASRSSKVHTEFCTLRAKPVEVARGEARTSGNSPIWDPR